MPTRSSFTHLGHIPRRLLLTAGATFAMVRPGYANKRRPEPSPPPAEPPLMAPGSSPLRPIETLARQAILIEFETGAVLLEKAADEPMTPSSMTKLMTLYVTFDHLRSGKLFPETLLPVSERAWKTGGSKMFVQVGTKIAVSDLLRGVAVDSGNDACVVLAEGMAGTTERFADLMNEYGARLGLKGSHFLNPNGLPETGHMMTARDLAILADALIRDFPDQYGLFNERSFHWSGITQGNRNPLLARVAGADGLKTGHTEAGGFGLVGSAIRDGRRVLMVLNGLPSIQARSQESARLLDWAFMAFENLPLFQAGEIIEEVPVDGGTRTTVPLVSFNHVVVTIAQGQRGTIQARIRYSTPVPAPIVKGTALGSLIVSSPAMREMSIPLYAEVDVQRVGVLLRLRRLLRFATGI